MMEGQLNVGGWENIVQVSAGLFHTVGLKEDGRVVAVGDNDDGQLNVGGWENIVQVSAGHSYGRVKGRRDSVLLLVRLLMVNSTWVVGKISCRCQLEFHTR